MNVKRTRVSLTRIEECSNPTATEKLPGCEKPHAKTVAWSYDLEGHARKCEKEQMYKVSTPCFDDHNFKKEELETVGELSDACSAII